MATNTVKRTTTTDGELAEKTTAKPADPDDSGRIATAMAVADKTDAVDGVPSQVEDRSGTKSPRTNVNVEEVQAPKEHPMGDQGRQDEDSNSGSEEFKDAKSTSFPSTPNPTTPSPEDQRSRNGSKELEAPPLIDTPPSPKPAMAEVTAPERVKSKDGSNDHKELQPPQAKGHTRQRSSGQGVSEWSHQRVISVDEKKEEPEGDEWQTMPAFAPYDMYDDNNKLIAREARDSGDAADAYAGLGGAGKGYTRVQLDEDAESATSLDENTQYLFKDINGGTGAGEMEDEEQRDAVSQMQATKDLLTEGQRIAYVGMTRIISSNMVKEAEKVEVTRGSKKILGMSAESLKMWSQKMMVRLYAHMDISPAEQIMIEQLAEHGVEPADMTPTLMQNARVKNPMAEERPRSMTSLSSPRPDSTASSSPRPSSSWPRSSQSTSHLEEEEPVAPPPPYELHKDEELPEVRTPSQLPTSSKLDIDLRWTVLCDLFLNLIADSMYDARSRVLLEKVGGNMDLSWVEICRFEKRVTDALEMQQEAEKENWNEDEHKENRRKLALKKRYVMMGLATVGGGLVIGLSAGLLAPMIGAGLAAGFSTIGVAGTSGFLAGAGGTAIITSGAVTTGGIIGVRAANRRTGAVKTFEYRPLHNNKRVNLIVTVSGWMTGKVDDVRLPFSTIDPVMGDIYSILWEPEMLSSMGATINILATEALTQGLQQVLGSTILIGLMAGLQLPIVLTKLAYLIDNPWTVSLERANAAGLILADSIIDRNLGTRPITFVGYSLGCKMIYSCLQELARKGAYGLVQNVYLFGSPIVVNKDEYLKVRSVVAGRFVNGYATNDWILGYLFRMTSGGIRRVAGLAPIEGVPGIENVDVTELVPGHMAYRTAMPKLLRERGWMVESDEFTEIEDADPDNHAERQRELINELEEARKEFEKKEKEKEGKGKFGFFNRKKKAMVERQEWEMYQESKDDPDSGKRAEDAQGNNHGVLFDIDAIRAELANEQMQVRELQSTLPPMKLVFDSSTTTSDPRASLRETKSHDATMMLTVADPRSSSSASRNGGSSPGRHNNGEVQMTFDTSYHSPASSTSHLPLRSPVPSFTESTDRAATLQRPDLKNSNTLPASTPVVNLDHNAWADDEEDYGKEKEVEMTFA